MATAVASWVGATGWYAVAVEAAVYAAEAYAMAAYTQAQIDESPNFKARTLVVSSAKSPQLIVYGKAWCGGTLMYANQYHLHGTDNFAVVKAIAHCGREVEAIEELFFDNDYIPAGSIDWGAGHITSGKYAVIAKNGTYAVQIEQHLGTSSQTQSPLLTAANAIDFPASPGDYRARGIAYTAYNFFYSSVTTQDPTALFASGVPEAIRALIKGAKVYDPRADSTNGGSGSQRFATPSTWAWSDNPIICAVDYMTQYMAIPATRIDWAWVITQANICDVTVAIPVSATEKRYTCNGVIALTRSHKDNLTDIMSSCAGYVTKVGGLWRPTAGAYASPSVSLTDADIVSGDDAITYVGSTTRDQRYNSVTAIYFSPENFTQEVDSLPMESATYVTRDGGDRLPKSLALPMTNSETQAQRICHKFLLQSDQQKSITIQTRWTGLAITIGDRVNVTLTKYNWTNKVFRCASWQLNPSGSSAPIQMTLVEDDSAAWADPLESEYSIRVNDVVTPGEVLIPTPTAGAGVGGEVTVANGNFEHGDWFWAPSDAAWTISIDPANAHQGSWVLKATTPAASTVVNAIKYPCSPGTKVSFGGWYKTSASLTGSIGFAVNWLDSTGAGLSNSNVATNSANTTWSTLSSTAIAPANTVWAQFFVYTNGTSVGTVYADDTWMNVGVGIGSGTGSGIDGQLPYLPPLMNSLPAGYYDNETLTVPDYKVYGSATVSLDNTIAFIGQQSIKVVGVAGNGANYGVILSPELDTVPNTYIRPNRRWIVSAAIMGNSDFCTSPYGVVAPSLSAQGSVSSWTASGSAKRPSAADTWEILNWELDLTADSRTWTSLLFNGSNANGALSGTPTFWVDAIQLIDVTDSPWITTSNLPTALIPAAGSNARPIERNTFKRVASSDVYTNSATMADDSELSCLLPQNTSFGFHMYVHMTCAIQGPNAKYEFSGPSGATIYYTHFGTNDLSAGFELGETTISGFNTSKVIPIGAANEFVQIQGLIITGANYGNFTFRWAQDSANATATYRKAGSWMHVFTTNV